MMVGMNKNFDEWNRIKKEIEINSKNILFKEGDIWWCTLGVNIRDESCGKGSRFSRPVLVVKKLSRTSFIGIPLSTQKKTGTWFCSVTVLAITRYVLLYQIRMLSTYRLQRRLTVLDGKEFYKVKQKLKTLLELL